VLDPAEGFMIVTDGFRVKAITTRINPQVPTGRLLARHLVGLCQQVRRRNPGPAVISLPGSIGFRRGSSAQGGR
jgi:hypothetical protein